MRLDRTDAQYNKIKIRTDWAARVRQTFGALILCLNGLSKTTTENIRRSQQFRARYFTTHPVRRHNGLFLPALSYILYMFGRTILYELSFKDTQKKNFSKQVLCPIKLPLRLTCTDTVSILTNLFKSLTKYVEYFTKLLYNYINNRYQQA